METKLHGRDTSGEKWRRERKGKFRDGLELLKAVIPIEERHGVITRSSKYSSIDEDEVTLKLLERYMIRRRYVEVQPDLPAKIRETVKVPLDKAGEEHFQDYLKAMQYADQLVFELARDGGRAQDALNDTAILGQWQKARRLLALSKVAGGYVADMIKGVVEDTGSCVVFTIHQDVSDLLYKQLMDQGLSVVRNDSRFSTKKRRDAIQHFQSGAADVYLGGLQIAQGFSLNRASVTVHTELDYSPDIMEQAEARAQGIGQEAPNGYIVRTCIAAYPDLAFDYNMDAIISGILARKVEGLKQIPGGHESLDPDAVLEVGQSESQVLIRRSWQRAQERLTREGITPRLRETKSSKKGSDKREAT